MSAEEAKKCLEIAKEAIDNHQYDRAIHFIQKSTRISPSPYAQELMMMAMKYKNKWASPEPSPKSTNDVNGEEVPNGAPNGIPKDISKPKTPESPEPPPVPPNYTQEQEKKCQEMLKQKDFYSILGVERTATQEDIKKAYRKKALRFHPDKNKAPSATEAFKKVSQSFACLSDEEKRKYYELHGTEEKAGIGGRYEDQFEDPFEMFNNLFGNSFFGGGVNMNMSQGFAYRQGADGATYMYRRGPNPNQGRPLPQASKYMILFQFAPFILIIGMSVLYSFMEPDKPLYQFERSGNYPYKKVTDENHIYYYISKTTSVDIQSYNEQQLENFEKELEKKYVDTAKIRCQNEKDTVRELKYYARMAVTQRMKNHYKERINNFHSNWCVRLEDVYSQGDQLE